MRYLYKLRTRLRAMLSRVGVPIMVRLFGGRSAAEIMASPRHRAFWHVLYPHITMLHALTHTIPDGDYLDGTAVIGWINWCAIMVVGLVLTVLDLPIVLGWAIGACLLSLAWVCIDWGQQRSARWRNRS